MFWTAEDARVVKIERMVVERGKNMAGLQGVAQRLPDACLTISLYTFSIHDLSAHPLQPRRSLGT
jgi:hypothetical protein